MFDKIKKFFQYVMSYNSNIEKMDRLVALIRILDADIEAEKEKNKILTEKLRGIHSSADAAADAVYDVFRDDVLLEGLDALNRKELDEYFERGVMPHIDDVLSTTVAYAEEEEKKWLKKSTSY